MANNKKAKRRIAVTAISLVLFFAAAVLIFSRIMADESAAEKEETLHREPAGEEITPEIQPSLAEKTLAGMTLHEKICQLFIVFPDGVAGETSATEAGQAMREALQAYPVGGFIYDKTHMESREQVTAMLQTTQTFAEIPMLFACDEEGGRVNRLMSTVGTTWVGPMLDYKDQGTEKAAENARTIAMDLVSCGFNADFAPVADVWSNPENTVIGDRAYSDDYAQAAELVAAAVTGFHAGGVACTLKHFPGHGDTSADSHYGSVYIYKSMDEIRREELLPFKAGIDAGADMVMMGHLIVTDVDENVPAVFSYEMVTEILRGELGFDGVVITDALQMQAMTDHYASGEIAVNAVKAGVDILLCPQDVKEAAAALEAAVENGEISEERIDESVLRILTMKENRGILTE